jgi:hypothetical protein
MAEVGGGRFAAGPAAHTRDADNQRSIAIQTYRLFVVAKCLVERLPRSDLGEIRSISVTLPRESTSEKSAVSA